jgi:hypothetical protein
MACVTSRLQQYPYLAALDDLQTQAGCALNDEARANRDDLVGALTAYRDGASLKSIESDYGYSRQLLYYHRDRFQEMGARSLIAYGQLLSERIADPKLIYSQKRGPYMLLAFFAAYPAIKEFLWKAAVLDEVPGQPKLLGPLSHSMLWDHMLKQAVAARVSTKAFPLFKPDNPDDADGWDQGLRALRQWVNKVRKEHRRLQALKNEQRIEDDPMRVPLSPVSRIYRRFQFDGHSIDVNWTVVMPSLRGPGVVKKRVREVWLLMYLDQGSTAVPGYAIAFGNNYDSADVLRAHRACLVPWKPRDLKGTTLAYRPGEGLPSGVLPELAYACADEVSMDRASSQRSDVHLTVMERTSGSTVIFGPVASPNVRPHIEGVFDIFEEAGIHPTYGTTGSNPQDKRRRRKLKPHYLLTMEQLLNVVDILIARWNGCKAPGTSQTRMEILRQTVQAGRQIIRHVPMAQRALLDKYDTFKVQHIGFRKGLPGVSWHGTWFESTALLKHDLKEKEPVLIATHSERVNELGVWRVHGGQWLGSIDIEHRWNAANHCLWALQSGARTPAHQTFGAQTGGVLNGTRADAAARGRRRGATAAFAQDDSEPTAPPQVPAGTTYVGDQQPAGNVVPLHPGGPDPDVAECLARLGAVY